MQHGLDYPDRGYYAMINAQPMPKESAPSRPPATAIKLELYWIVSCTDATRSLPLRDDDAASRYCLSEHSIVDQDDVESASAYVDDLDQLGMRLSFTPDGSEKLSRATTAKNDAELGLVIDGDLVLKALVREPLEHEAIITGAGLHKDQLLDWVERLSLNSEVRKRALKKGT